LALLESSRWRLRKRTGGPSISWITYGRWKVRYTQRHKSMTEDRTAKTSKTAKALCLPPQGRCATSEREARRRTDARPNRTLLWYLLFPARRAPGCWPETTLVEERENISWRSWRSSRFHMCDDLSRHV
jgi:hypothetical protein